MPVLGLAWQSAPNVAQPREKIRKPCNKLEAVRPRFALVFLCCRLDQGYCSFLAWFSCGKPGGQVAQQKMEAQRCLGEIEVSGHDAQQWECRG